MHPHFRILLLGVLVFSAACGGTVTEKHEGELRTEGQSTGGAGSDNGATLGGGSAGHAASSDADASSTAPPDAAPPDCPITKSGTELTEEDCHRCFLPNRECPMFPSVSSSSSVTSARAEEVCVNLARTPGTFWCLWYADGDPFDQTWGAMSVCPSVGGHVYCGGGL